MKPIKHLFLLASLTAFGGGLLASCGGGGSNEELTFTVKFESNGGSKVASQTVKYGAKASKPANPTKSGYTFGAWYVDEALKVTFDFSTEITADWTLYASWTSGGTIASDSSEESKGSEASNPTSASTAGQDVPTTGFYIVVNGASYHELTGGEPWDMDPTFHQYQCLNVTLALNDVISFYDADNAAGWSEMTIDPASVGSFTQGESGIVCGEAGTFDMYVKLKYGADNIYFGYHA